MDGSRIILAAHRGDKFKRPENTMPAFLAAIDFGVDMIETDVRMTKDKELIIIHDRSALRTAGVDKNVDEMTLAEVKELDAGHVFSDEFKNTKIPTAREFIELAKKAGILVNWELKVYPNEFGDEVAFEVADKLVALIEEYDMVKNSMLNSFSSRVLEYIYKKYGNRFPLHGQGIYNCRMSNDNPQISENEFFDWCCLYPNKPGFMALDFKENFDYCVENNVLPCLCIPDNTEDYKKALEYGCKMFTSNNIYECDKVLKELGVR